MSNEAQPNPNRVEAVGRGGPIAEDRQPETKQISRKERDKVHRDAGRVPPQAIDVEQAIIGAMLLDREAIPKVIEILPQSSFYDPKHEVIYNAILRLFRDGNPVDLVTISEELKRMGESEKVDTFYLTELTTGVASAANVEYHARIVAEKALLRGLIETMTSVVGQAYDPTTDAFDLLDQAEQAIFRISESQLRKSSVVLNELVKTSLLQIDNLSRRKSAITGVPSGFHVLDNLTSGWQRSDLIVLAARPSMGKTALSLMLTRNAALHEDRVPVAYFSLEMSNHQLAQ